MKARATKCVILEDDASNRRERRRALCCCADFVFCGFVVCHLVCGLVAYYYKKPSRLQQRKRKQKGQPGHRQQTIFKRPK